MGQLHANPNKSPTNSRFRRSSAIELGDVISQAVKLNGHDPTKQTNPSMRAPGLTDSGETNGGGNPTARVANLSQTLIYANDNWVGGAMTLNGQPVGSTEQVYPFYFNGVGRVPNRGTDAAMLMLFPPGEAVCMYSREESSGTLIPASLAMTDITSTIAGARSASSEDLSLLDRLLPRP